MLRLSESALALAALIALCQGGSGSARAAAAACAASAAVGRTETVSMPGTPAREKDSRPGDTGRPLREEELPSTSVCGYFGHRDPRLYSSVAMGRSAYPGRVICEPRPWRRVWAPRPTPRGALAVRLVKPQPQAHAMPGRA
jgi:hypothetical protein